FGSEMIMSTGFDHIYVAQRKHTQYQFLTAEDFSSIINDVINGKDVYTYGSSLGAYCAIYYRDEINAYILDMSPLITAHLVIINNVINGKDVYIYGSNLGAYCTIYYGGSINANILARSPRIPAHPVINKLMGKRFKNKKFLHKE